MPGTARNRNSTFPSRRCRICWVVCQTRLVMAAETGFGETHTGLPPSPIPKASFATLRQSKFFGGLNLSPLGIAEPKRDRAWWDGFRRGWQPPRERWGRVVPTGLSKANSYPYPYKVMNLDRFDLA